MMELIICLNIFMIFCIIGILMGLLFYYTVDDSIFLILGLIAGILVGLIGCGFVIKQSDSIIEGQFELVDIDNNILTSSKYDYYNFHIYDENMNITSCKTSISHSKIIEIPNNETQYVILKKKYGPDEIFPLAIIQSAEFYIHVGDN